MAADALSRENPESWLRFVAEFKLYAENIVLGMLEAAPQNLPCAQGRGQEAYNILAMLEFCRQKADAAKRAEHVVNPSPLLNKSAGAKQRES